MFSSKKSLKSESKEKITDCKSDTPNPNYSDQTRHDDCYYLNNPPSKCRYIGTTKDEMAVFSCKSEDHFFKRLQILLGLEDSSPYTNKSRP